MADTVVVPQQLPQQDRTTKVLIVVLLAHQPS
jgi:hypothetical protein